MIVRVNPHIAGIRKAVMLLADEVLVAEDCDSAYKSIQEVLIQRGYKTGEVKRVNKYIRACLSHRAKELKS